MILRVSIVLLILLLIDWYFFQAVKTVLINSSNNTRRIIYVVYWAFTVFTVFYIITALIIPPANWPRFIRVYCTSFIFILSLSKLMGIIILMFDDIIRLFRWVASLFQQPETGLTNDANKISRLKFLNQTAIIIAAIPFASLLYGMIKGAFDYKLRNIKINLAHLPGAFNGFKIVQISDIHTGSFTSTEPLKRAVELINAQNPDVVFFTGDLVNDIADEADNYIETLGLIKAKHGIFSVLGNHDYGDYVSWESAEAKEKNMEKMKSAHQKMGWKLLLNENYILEKGDDKIAIAGVENWGASHRFTKYGNLEKAIQGIENIAVKLLLSHDPSHWDAEIKQEYPGITVTFSGHTHGMQFGVNIPAFKWSPVQYFYKKWSGLYTENNQHLYVNTGLGFIGYAGRVGIVPEITVHELYNFPA